MATYRMIISYLPEKEVYQARAPELVGAMVEAPTRAEAVAELEEEITAQVEVMKEQGNEPPAPLDATELDGKLSLEVTPELHRELLFLAAAENTELSLLVNDLLLRAVAHRWGAGRRPRKSGGAQHQGNRDSGRNRPREGHGSRYHNIMENQAEFMEYVRSMDNGGGRPRGGGRRKKK